jgi:site-specific recombinase XerD
MATNVQRACNSIAGFAQKYEEFSRKLIVKQYSMRTIEGYASRVAAISLHYGKLPEDLSSEEINRYMHYTLTSRQTPSRILFEKTRAGLSSYYRELGFPERCIMLPSVRKFTKLPVVLSFDEIYTLLHSAIDIRSKAILGMLYSCGLRVSELCSLEVQDINSGRMSVHVRQGKGRKDRYVPLAENMLPVLRQYYRAYRPQTFLFTSSCTCTFGQKITAREVSDILSVTCFRMKTAKHITCHTLRHTYASHLLEMHENILVVQRLLGHKWLSSTLKYLQVVFPQAGERRYFSPLDVLLKKRGNED